MGTLVEGVADLLVIGAAAEVEEVDSYFASGNGYFFDSVVDTDGGNVLLHETPLAIAFNYAGFAYTGVPN